jgi:hypothetical protein
MPKSEDGVKRERIVIQIDEIIVEAATLGDPARIHEQVRSGIVDQIAQHGLPESWRADAPILRGQHTADLAGSIVQASAPRGRS